MSYERRAYDDADTTAQMTRDAVACGTRLVLPRQRSLTGALPAARGRRGAWTEPGTHPPVTQADAAAARLAARLHLG